MNFRDNYISFLDFFNIHNHFDKAFLCSNRHDSYDALGLVSDSVGSVTGALHNSLYDYDLCHASGADYHNDLDVFDDHNCDRRQQTFGGNFLGIGACALFLHDIVRVCEP